MNAVDNFKQEAIKTKEWLSTELSKIRTGRATSSFLDPVLVESYGSMMPLNQVASINTEDARTLRIAPWDKNLISQIESAITRADLGVSVSSDDQGVRVHFPELTAENREKISKAAKQKHEEARIALRSVRDEARTTVMANQKNSELSEDEAHKMLENIDTITSTFNKDFDELYDKKHKELTTL